MLKDKLPFPVKQMLKFCGSIIPLPIRYGKYFRDKYKFLNASQWWSAEELKNYQLLQLKKLLKHAFENVPYYRRTLLEHNLTPDNFNNLEDLGKLSFLTKKEISANFSELQATNYVESQIKVETTSGTTGTKLSFVVAPHILELQEWAFVWRQWNWAGIRFGDRRVVIRGKVFSRFVNGKKQLYEYDPLEKTLILSSYNMNNETLPEYLRLIKRFNPCAIQGYPSSLAILTDYMSKNNIAFNGVRAVLTSSETLTLELKNAIQKVFKAPVFDHYGHSERSALIMQCEKQNYHIIPEYGIVELVKTEFSAQEDYYEIVATGFHNLAFPFIRYRTMDLVVLQKEQCSCGRAFPTIRKIEGRIQDFLVSAHGDLIPLIGNADGLNWEFSDKIQRAQLYQDQPGVLKIKIVKNERFGEEDSSKIIFGFQKRYGNDFQYSIEFVNDLPRQESGKFRFLVQKLPIK